MKLLFFLFFLLFFNGAVIIVVDDDEIMQVADSGKILTPSSRPLPRAEAHKKKRQIDSPPSTVKC